MELCLAYEAEEVPIISERLGELFHALKCIQWFGKCLLKGAWFDFSKQRFLFQIIHHQTRNVDF